MDIELKAICKKFQDADVLKNLNITFLEGEMNCLMGPSGSGKTTVINCLMGFVKPDSGELLGLEGRRIAAVFQEDRLIEHWNAVKNVKLVCDKSVSEEHILNELRAIGLEEEDHKAVRDYSGGMRRRVAVVRAMLAKSDLVILDEPFKGLDDVLKAKVIDYVKCRTKGKTVILVTHDREELSLLDANLIML